MAMANTVNIVDQAASEEAPETVVVAAAGAAVVVTTPRTRSTSAPTLVLVPVHSLIAM